MFGLVSFLGLQLVLGFALQGSPQQNQGIALEWGFAPVLALIGSAIGFRAFRRGTSAEHSRSDSSRHVRRLLGLLMGCALGFFGYIGCSAYMVFIPQPLGHAYVIHQLVALLFAACCCYFGYRAGR